MKTTILITALAIAIAAPALAQSTSTRFAVEHFNQTADTASEMIAMPLQTDGTVVSTEGDTALALATEVVGDDILGFVSVFPSDPAYATDVFDRLASE